MIRLKIEHEERIDASKLGSWDRFLLFLRLQKYALPLWDKVLARVLCTQAAGMLVLVPPILMVQLIDDVFPSGDAAGLAAIVGLCLLSLTLAHVLLFIGGIPTNFQTAWIVPESALGNYTIARIMLHLKVTFFRHLQRSSLRFFRGRPIGDHMFRGSTDLDDAALLASESIPLISSTTQRIVMASYLLIQLGGMLFVFILAYLAVFFSLKQLLITRYRRLDRSFRQQNAELEAVTREILASNKLVKGYSRERTARRWYGGQASRALRKLFRREIFMFLDLHITSNAFNVCLPFFAMFYGTFVLSGEKTLGEYLSAASLMYFLVTPLQESISLYQLIRQRLVPVERMIETLDVKPEMAAPPGATRPSSLTGKVELRNVTFSYHAGQPVLDGVSLVANPGEKVAIVGAIGAGKSTLTCLLLRLYDPDSGQVLIDDRDAREYEETALRRHMAIVMQQVAVFTMTIRENILYGKPLGTPEEMRRAARLAGADEFIDPLPRGYETTLEEGGSLSGGQKQRLCIARALIRNPAVLVLDEATSALDPVTEKAVVEAIDGAFADRTRIVVAHNLFSAISADRIHVMDRGRIVETGTHAELMRANGVYARLWAAGSVAAQATG